MADPGAVLGLPEWLFWTGVAFLGLCVGSFLNVVIHRLPIMMQRQEEAWARETVGVEPERTADAERFDLVVPRSRCPQCHRTIRARDNVPVISWLLLRGRCAACGAPISVRYPLVELATAILTLIVVGLFGATWPGLWALVFTWSLLAAALIDVDEQILPDVIVLPLLWLGLLVNVSGTFAPLEQAVVGAAIGYGTLWAVYWGFRLVTGKEGMGFGDFKLMGAMGAWLGWPALPGVVLLASVAGIVAAVAMTLLGRLQRGAPMPFGPFIAVAGWLAAMMLAADPAQLPF